MRMSLERLETKIIHPKQRIEMLVRIENSGEVPIEVPIAPQLEDVQANPSAIPYDYYSLELPLEAGLPSGGTVLGWWALYGSTSKPETLLNLKPGQSLYVKGKVVIVRWYSTEQAVTALTTFRLSRNVSTTNENTDGSRRAAHCIEVVTGNTLPATVEAVPR